MDPTHFSVPTHSAAAATGAPASVSPPRRKGHLQAPRSDSPRKWGFLGGGHPVSEGPPFGPESNRWPPPKRVFRFLSARAERNAPGRAHPATPPGPGENREWCCPLFCFSFQSPFEIKHLFDFVPYFTTRRPQSQAGLGQIFPAIFQKGPEKGTPGRGKVARARPGHQVFPKIFTFPVDAGPVRVVY